MNLKVLVCSLFNALSLSSNLHHVSVRGSSIHPQNGFLKQSYSVLNEKGKLFMARQVPGDGGCLFHAIGTWLMFLQRRTHVQFDSRSLELSEYLRSLSVDVLLRNESLCIEDEYDYSSHVVSQVASHYNVSVEKYISSMLHPKTWGGGPEILALSHHFQCPIFVYQLTHKAKGLFDWRRQFCLKLSAKFGYPAFKNKPPLSLLCVDGRFPDILPGEENKSGDHFMPLFPCTSSNELATVDSSLYPLHKCPLLTRITEQVDRHFVRNEVKRSLSRVMAFRRRHSTDSQPFSFKSSKLDTQS